jgi:Rha family phage regulatory protein
MYFRISNPKVETGMKALTTTKHGQGDLVAAVRGEARTDSLLVASEFGKQHGKVLRAIRDMECPDDFSRANFGPRDYIDERGKAQPYYEMTRDGFMLLVMSFTGKKAMDCKIKFIAAFNMMEKAIQQRSNAAWIEQRETGKVVRRELTDTVQAFVEYATEQGSKNATHYYSNITKMTHKALFMVKQASPKPFRDMLATMKLSFLMVAEEICRSAILDGMNQGMHYKEIYQYAKTQVENYAAMLPETRLLA